MTVQQDNTPNTPIIIKIKIEKNQKKFETLK